MILSLCVLNWSLCLPVSARNDDVSVEKVISEGLYAFSQSIDISRFQIYPDELLRIVSSVIKDDPYLFFVNGRMSYSYKPGGFVLSLKPTYLMSREETSAALEYCKRTVKEIAAMAREHKDRMKMTLFVHDYICNSFEYDDSLVSDDLYDFLKNGRGTCQGYAASFLAIMRECGAGCHYVASDTVSHIWNYVEIDGEWYHADLTWDDSDTGVSRRHFLLSDRLAAERGHRDWYSSVSVTCVSEKYADFDFDSLILPSHKSGDNDHDGMIGVSDLICLRRCLATGDRSEICAFCADINCDGTLDVADIELFRKKLLDGD